MKDTTTMTELTILILTILISFFLVWFFAYKPLVSITSKLSVKIMNEIIPDIQSSHNLITTLSASAIVLSFTALQAFKNQKLISANYLTNSWYLFGASVLFGTLAGIVIYILKAQSSVMIKAFEDHQNNKDVSKDTLRLLLKMKIKQTNILLGLLLAQSVMFVSAIAFLVVFAKNNLV